MTLLARFSQPKPARRHQQDDTVAIDLGAQLETERAVAALERKHETLERDHTELLAALLARAPEGWHGPDPATSALSYVRAMEDDLDHCGRDRRPPWERAAERATYLTLPDLLNDRPDLAYVLNPKAPVPNPGGTGGGGSGEGGTPAHSGLAGTPSPETAEKSSGPASGPPSDTGPDSGTEGEPESEEDCAEDGGAA